MPQQPKNIQERCNHFWSKWHIRPVTEGEIKKTLWQRICMHCALMETVTRHDQK